MLQTCEISNPISRWIHDIWQKTISLKGCLVECGSTRPLSWPESSRPGSSQPGQISAWSYIKPGGYVFNKNNLFDKSWRKDV